MNYPIGTTLGQFRDYFRKHGTVINLREFIQGDCIGVAIVSFDTRLEARRACSMNQNFMNGKRLLIHMADEKLFLDPELCVGVMGLSTATTDEHIYDRFSEIGAVKFVLRETSGRAVVCMEHRRWLDAVMRVILVGKSRVQVSRLFGGPARAIRTCRTANFSRGSMGRRRRKETAGCPGRRGLCHGQT